MKVINLNKENMEHGFNPKSSVGAPVGSGAASSALGGLDPYAGQEVRGTVWDWLGFSNKQSDALRQLETASAEYQAELAKMDYQNEYNEYMYNKYESPSAVVAQMRAAGQNPDLQDMPSVSAPQSADASLPNVSGNMQPSTDSAQVMSAIGQAFSVAFNIYGSLQSAKVMSGQAEAQSLDNTSKIIDIAKKLGLSVPENFANQAFADSTEGKQTLVGGMFSHMYPRTLRRKTQNAINAAVTNYLGSPDFKASYYKNMGDAVTNVKNYKFEKSMPDFNGWNMDDVSDSVVELGKLAFDLKKYDFQAKINKTKYESDYFGTVSGREFGNYDTKMMQFDLSATEAAKKKQAAMDNMINKLLYSESDWKRVLGFALVSIIQNTSLGFNFGASASRRF